MTKLILLVGVLFSLFLFQSCKRDCDPLVPRDHPIMVDYREKETGNSLINDDENLEENVSMYDESNDTLYFEVFENQAGTKSFIILPYVYSGLVVGNEYQSVFYIDYYGDVDTLKIVSFFDLEDCGYNLKYLDLYINEELIQQDESAIYSILK